MTLGIVKLGASRLSDSGLPIVTATDQIGDGTREVEHFGEIDHFNGLGLTARPFPANDSGHAETLVDRNVAGTTGVAIGGRDERCADMYGALGPGDTCVHATGPSHSAQMMCKEDGSVTMVTTDDGTATGRSVFWQTDKDAFRGVAPWGRLTFDATGFHVRHHTGARIDLGGVGGLPAPLDSMGAYVSISAPVLRLTGGAVAIGQGLGDAAAKATPTLAVLAAIATSLTAIGAALNGINVALVPTGSASVAVTPATAAIVAAVSAISTAATLIPATTVTVA